MQADTVHAAVESQHAIVVTIGQGPTKKPVSMFLEGTKKVIAAMRQHGVEKLICVTGIKAGDSKGHGGFSYDKIFNPLLLKTIYADKDRQEALIRDSTLKWIIVRPGFLTNGKLTGHYKIITDLKKITTDKISRADVAHFILSQLDSMTYLRKSPLLTR